MPTSSSASRASECVSLLLTPMLAVCRCAGYRGYIIQARTFPIHNTAFDPECARLMECQTCNCSYTTRATYVSLCRSNYVDMTDSVHLTRIVG